MCVCVVGISIMLYIIGLGLGDEKDITLRGLETVRKCDKVYIEAYTSLLSFGLSAEGFSKLVKLTNFLFLFVRRYIGSLVVFSVFAFHSSFDIWDCDIGEVVWKASSACR